jgi:phage gp36-like protein
MAYATSDDVLARLERELAIQLTDDDGAGVADTTVIDAAIADADAEIDHALDGRYVVPLDPVPPIARRWSVDLAINGLYLRRSEMLPPQQAERAHLTRRALQTIADGLSGLAGAAAGLRNHAAESSRRGEDPVWDAEELANY